MTGNIREHEPHEPEQEAAGLAKKIKTYVEIDRDKEPGHDPHITAASSNQSHSRGSDAEQILDHALSSGLYAYPRISDIRRIAILLSGIHRELRQ